MCCLFFSASLLDVNECFIVTSLQRRVSMAQLFLLPFLWNETWKKIESKQEEIQIESGLRKRHLEDVFLPFRSSCLCWLPIIPFLNYVALFRVHLISSQLQSLLIHLSFCVWLSPSAIFHQNGLALYHPTNFAWFYSRGLMHFLRFSFCSLPCFFFLSLVDKM